MTPVDQIKSVATHGYGDCFQASLATLLDLPLDGVPDFNGTELAGGPDFDTQLRTFLASRGQAAIRLQLRDEGFKALFAAPYGQHVILCGPGPRFYPEGHARAGKRIRHAVVGKLDGYRIDIVHDPHASRGGLLKDVGGYWDIYIIGAFAGAAI
jgi:hypothetical protein